MVFHITTICFTTHTLSYITDKTLIVYSANSSVLTKFSLNFPNSITPSSGQYCSHLTWNDSATNQVPMQGLQIYSNALSYNNSKVHDDVMKWKHFPRYWPFVRGIHRVPVNSLHKGQWRGALMFSLICAWRNDWVNIREAGDLRPYSAHYDVTVTGIRMQMITAHGTDFHIDDPLCGESIGHL